MCGHTIKDKLRNEIIRVEFEVVPIIEKLVETCLRWLGHVQRRPMDAPVHRVDQMVENPIIQRKDRQKKTIQETIQKDLAINNLTVDMCKDRTRWH